MDQCLNLLRPSIDPARGENALIERDEKKKVGKKKGCFVCFVCFEFDIRNLPQEQSSFIYLPIDGGQGSSYEHQSRQSRCSPTHNVAIDTCLCEIWLFSLISESQRQRLMQRARVSLDGVMHSR